MKRLLGILTILLIIQSCDNEDPGLPTDCIEVTLMDMMCGQAIMQIQDPKYYYLGESANGYEHVFFTYPHCEDLNLNLSGTFSVEFTKDDDKGSCSVCLALLPYDGKKVYNVRIKKCNG